MVYDCFTFFNELEILDLRLNVLNCVVDKFVVVESTKTYTGNPKPLLFNINKHLFDKFLDKIIHVVVDDMPDPISSSNVWNLENHQRNCIIRGLTNAKDDDLILISDVDEIPHPDSINYGKHKKSVIGCEMSLYYYYVNCKQNVIWRGTVMLPFSYLRSIDIQSVRNGRASCEEYHSSIGWHFSFLGGSKRILEKLESYAETQTNVEKNKSAEHINKCLESGYDLFHRSDDKSKKMFVDIDSSYPIYMLEWLEKFPEMIKKDIPKNE